MIHCCQYFLENARTTILLCLHSHSTGLYLHSASLLVCCLVGPGWEENTSWQGRSVPLYNTQELPGIRMLKERSRRNICETICETSLIYKLQNPGNLFDTDFCWLWYLGLSAYQTKIWARTSAASGQLYAAVERAPRQLLPRERVVSRGLHRPC